MDAAVLFIARRIVTRRREVQSEFGLISGSESIRNNMTSSFTEKGKAKTPFFKVL